MPALSATALSCRQINLAWVDNSNNESAYVVELSRDAGTTYKFKVVGSEDFTKLGAFQHIGQIGVSAHRGIPGIFPPLTKNP